MLVESIPTSSGGSAWSRLSRLLLLAMLAGCALAAVAQGSILCECLTPECREDGETTCRAAHYCYSETVHGVVSKGCIDDSSPLLCENRKPQGKGIDNWPALSCCNHRDFCNRDDVVTPRPPQGADTSRLSNEASDMAGREPATPTGLEVPQDPQEGDLDGDGGDDVGGAAAAGEGGAGGDGGGKSRGRHDPLDAPAAPYPLPPCQSSGQGDEDHNSGAGGQRSSSSSNSSGGGGKVINPIYIAVPVAGVCVLLALVIFAMYLLRRRQHYHHHFDNYHHYHDHLQPQAPNSHPYPSPAGGGGGSSSSGGRPQSPHPHLHPHPHPHHHHHHHPHLLKNPGGGGLLLASGGKGGEPLLLPGGSAGGSGVGGSLGGSGLPLYAPQQPHLCDCVCQKTLPPCAGKVNRCTDSERTSSGSETKLFLRA